MYMDRYFICCKHVNILCLVMNSVKRWKDCIDRRAFAFLYFKKRSYNTWVKFITKRLITKYVPGCLEDLRLIDVTL